jgi:hypothetical protein
LKRRDRRRIKLFMKDVIECCAMYLGRYFGSSMEEDFFKED